MAGRGGLGNDRVRRRFQGFQERLARCDGEALKGNSGLAQLVGDEFRIRGHVFDQKQPEL